MALHQNSKQFNRNSIYTGKIVILLFCALFAVNITGCALFTDILGGASAVYSDLSADLSSPPEKAFRTCSYNGDSSKQSTKMKDECAKIVSDALSEINNHYDAMSRLIKANNCYIRIFGGNTSRCRLNNDDPAWDILKGTNAIVNYARRLNAMEKYLPNIKSSAIHRINELNNQYKSEANYPAPLSDNEIQQLNKCYANANKLKSNFAASWFIQHHDKKLCEYHYLDNQCNPVTILKSDGTPMPGHHATDYIFRGYMHSSEIYYLIQALNTDWNNRGKTFPKGCEDIINKEAIYKEAYKHVKTQNADISDHNESLSNQITSEKDLISNYENDLDREKSLYNSSISTYCNNITNNLESFKSSKLSYKVPFTSTIIPFSSLMDTSSIETNYEIIKRALDGVKISKFDITLLASYDHEVIQKKHSEFTKQYNEFINVISTLDMAVELCQSPEKRSSIVSLISEPQAFNFIHKTYPNANLTLQETNAAEASSAQNSKSDLKPTDDNETITNNGKASVAAVPPSNNKGLTAQQVINSIKASESSISKCATNGNLVVSFSITPAGKPTAITAVSGSFKGTVTEKCIITKVSQIKFPESGLGASDVKWNCKL